MLIYVMIHNSVCMHGERERERETYMRGLYAYRYVKKEVTKGGYFNNVSPTVVWLLLCSFVQIVMAGQLGSGLPKGLPKLPLTSCALFCASILSNFIC